MSKTTNMSRKEIRWHLLVSVSAAALLASVYGASEAEAAGNDSNCPPLWIELGGQLDRLSDAQDTYTPPFMAAITQANLLSGLSVQQSPAYTLDETGKISFQPDDSNWVFSASVRFGRAHSTLHKHQQTANAKIPVRVTLPFPPPHNKYWSYTFYPYGHVKFTDGQATHTETHAILDFQAGKDVGLGMFGGHGVSVLSAGVRIAQFTSKANINLHAEPDVHYPSTPINSFSALRAFKYNNPVHINDYATLLNSQRDFHGLGPSLAWTGSMPVAGDARHGELDVDWGVNAAVLFGRQRASVYRQTITRRFYGTHLEGVGGVGAGAGAPGEHDIVFDTPLHTGAPPQTYYHRTGADFHRMRSVTVPNVGGTIGLSYRIEDFKVSMGYRADFFFNAIDGGIDARKEETRGFFGPFASISVGLGD